MVSQTQGKVHKVHLFLPMHSPKSKKVEIGEHAFDPRNVHAMSIPGQMNVEGGETRYFKINQDAYLINYTTLDEPTTFEQTIAALKTDFCFYGVFDGHGIKGEYISDWVKQLLPLALETSLRREATKELTQKDILQALKLAVDDVCAQIKPKKLALASGTTFCGGWIDPGSNTLYLANIGDSECCLFRRTSKPQDGPLTYSYKSIHPLHTPSNPSEHKRVLAEGGKIVSGRLCDPRQLNLTRSIGNYESTSSGLSEEAEYFVESLDSWDYVVFGSDGLFDVTTKKEIAEILFEEEFFDEDVENQLLINLAQKNWIRETGGRYIDDITSIVVPLL